MNSYEPNKSSIEANRNRGTGRFQTWQSKEAGEVSLTVGPDAPPALTAAEADGARPGRDHAVDLYDDYRVIEKAAAVDDAFNYIDTPAGGQLGYEYFAYQKYDPYAVWGEVKGNDFHRFDELAELGWGGRMKLLARDGRRLLGLQRIADEGITPHRMARLIDAHLGPWSSEWTKDAMIAADDDTLDRIRGSWNPHNATDHYKAVINSTGDTQKITRMNECHDARIYDPELIEAVEFDKDHLLNLEEFTGPGNPEAVLKLARNGHTPETIRTYGVSSALYGSPEDLARGR